MPRPTIKIKLVCSWCKKGFELLRWQVTQKLRRGTESYFCSADCKHNTQRGKLSGTWKGGRRAYPSCKGYVTVNVSPGKRMAEHRFVMQNHLGRELRKGEVVHHLNEDPSDNRIENLVLCESAGKHIAMYHRKPSN